MKTNPLGSVPTTAQAPKSNEDAKLRAVSKQFESIFVNQLVNAMRQTVNKEGGFLPEGPGEKVWQSMLDSEYAGKIADSNQLGFSNMVYEQLKRIK
jgi:peptidoglycan hydrolase FlgJ